jgi:HSP20 family protein
MTPGLGRWSPVRDALRLSEEMNRLFDPRYAAEGENLANTWVPPVDIYEDAEGVTVRAELPGMSAADIDVRIEDQTLTLKGERRLKDEDKRDQYRRIERWYGAFSRSFTLPTSVDTDRVKAESKDGVLTVFLPRREETKPRQIRVSVQ